MKATRATTGWPVEMPPRIAAGVVGEEARPAILAPSHLVGVLLARQRRGGEAGADLDALGGVDRHQRAGQLGVELAVDRRAPARRHALGLDLDDGAGGGAGLADLVEVSLPTARIAASGHQKGFLPTSSQSQLRAVDLAAGRSAPGRRGSSPRAQHLARDRAGRDPRRRLARRGAPAAAVVAHAVFGEIGVVGVAGPELVAMSA